MLCPRCHTNELDPVEVRNALSRRDNDTYICSPCGQEEAFLDAGLIETNLVTILTRENGFRRQLGLKVTK